MLLHIERAKIVFAVGVIIGREVFKASNLLKDFKTKVLRQILDTLGQHHPASEKSLSRQVIQRCNLAGLLVM